MKFALCLLEVRIFIVHYIYSEWMYVYVVRLVVLHHVHDVVVARDDDSRVFIGKLLTEKVVR